MDRTFWARIAFGAFCFAVFISSVSALLLGIYGLLVGAITFVALMIISVRAENNRAPWADDWGWFLGLFMQSDIRLLGCLWLMAVLSWGTFVLAPSGTPILDSINVEKAATAQTTKNDHDRYMEKYSRISQGKTPQKTEVERSEDAKRSEHRSWATYWVTLVCSLFLTACAFVYIFFALSDDARDALRRVGSSSEGHAGGMSFADFIRELRGQPRAPQPVVVAPGAAPTPTQPAPHSTVRQAASYIDYAVLATTLFDLIRDLTEGRRNRRHTP